MSKTRIARRRLFYPSGTVSEPPRELQALVGLYRAFECPLLRHITEDKDDSDDSSVGVSNRRTAIVDGKFQPALADQHRAVSESHYSVQPKNFLDRIFYGFASLLVYDSKHLRERFANGFFGFPFRQCFSHGIHQCDQTLGIGCDHSVTDASQGRAEPLLLRYDGEFQLPRSAGREEAVSRQAVR